MISRQQPKLATLAVNLAAFAAKLSATMTVVAFY